MIFFFVFLTLTFLWLLFPLIPSLLEFVRPTDIDPLKVVSRDSGDIAFFANNFRNYFLTQAEKFDFTTIQDTELSKLPDGSPFIRIRGNVWNQKHASAPVDYIVIAGPETTLPDDVTFLREVYGVGGLTGGVGCAYRAILADKSLTLLEQSIVLRWVHSIGKLTVQEGSILHGRASSDEELCLAIGVTFEWISAPVIFVGKTEIHSDTSPMQLRRVVFNQVGLKVMADGTYRFEGDISIPANSLFTGNIVVSGQINVGYGAHVKGSMKAYKDIKVGGNCKIDGSVVTRLTINIEKLCIIQGPLIAEAGISIGQGSIIGSKEKHSTVSAPSVTIYSGAVIYGMVVAQHIGQTSA
ncbi:polymer-forming cytoskeletal protein [Oryzomonas rubra]|uniref:Polymer-forming protein n=1 Tax=Oryzomonas rubra TaxID=2509454 RepID=A0A5A9XQG0_9BACT|nr:polymer-forming cytoskeletal protein [Oryzomonas rubra]KAA0895224.1 hypothetical protein ET418_01510 [Oryzomonas rubra]